MSDAAATFIVNNHGNILMLKRGSTAPWMPNKWNLPGGKVDPGETPLQAAVREAAEETSLKITDLTLLETRREPWGTLHLYLTESWSGVPKRNWESSELRWMSPRDALKSDLVPGLAPAFEEMARQSMTQNPLLSRPPKSEHRLRNTKAFRDFVGRQPTEEDYHGVHTTSSRLIAQAYAMGTWRNNEGQGYPVVVTLDVSGLKPHPDVDAMIRGGEAQKHFLPEHRQRAKDGESFYDMLEDEGYDDTWDTTAGDDPAAFVFEAIGLRSLAAIETYAERHKLDAQDVFDSYLESGVLPQEALMYLVEQQRYFHDFDITHVVRIEAMQPWWSAVLWSWDDVEANRVESDGFYVFTMDQWPFSSSGTTGKVLWEAPDAALREHVEFHGTSSPAVESAFPGIIPTATPFPLRGQP